MSVDFYDCSCCGRTGVYEDFIYWCAKCGKALCEDCVPVDDASGEVLAEDCPFCSGKKVNDKMRVEFLVDKFNLKLEDIDKEIKEGKKSE